MLYKLRFIIIFSNVVKIVTFLLHLFCFYQQSNLVSYYWKSQGEWGGECLTKFYSRTIGGTDLETAQIN